ncbi:hypothetical protein P3T76_004163 [Phytophthora citrophthora]|uniref:Uncharacterized protein n=1 Tax=Phytophthora citrophthora TaxID=4793 RepID=A0AAD9GUD0_9STRA|nr:hypothetical protein P3T76_004163 [Phytophthora citrophthora]
MDHERIDQKIVELSPRLDVTSGSPNAEDIDTGLSLLEEVETYLTHSVYGNNADNKTNIVVLGTTGGGKSTVVSFLFGEGRIVVRHESEFSRVLMAESPLPGVSIQSGGTSVSLLPVVNHVKLQDEPVAVWDMPGSRDTRGPFVELVVHFTYRWMLKDDKNLKFIIVSPPPLERPQIVALEKMINGSLVRQDNAIVVYTKCDSEFDPNSTSVLNISDTKRDIHSFALRAPMKANEDEHDYSSEYSDRKTTILHALWDLRPSQVEFDEILPDSAKLLLHSMTKTCIERVQETLSACFIRLYSWDSYRATYEDICTTLEMLKSADPLCLLEMIDVLTRLVPAVGDDFQKDEAFFHARRRLFLIETLNGDEPQRRHVIEWLNAKGVQALEEAKEKLLEVKGAVETYRRSAKISDATLVISAFHLRLSNEKEAIEKFVTKREKAIDYVCNIPTVLLVGLASLDVDVDLQLWANIGLVSPSIQVTTQGGFNLSAHGQAQSRPKQNSKPGAEGRHGSIGLPGGSLVVVSQQLNDDNVIVRSTKSQGQSGGNAQDGGAGVNGKDSSYNENSFRDAIDHCISIGLLSEKDSNAPEEDGNSNVPRDLSNGLRLVKFKREDSPLRMHGGLGHIPGKTTAKVTKASVPGDKRIPGGNGGQGGAGGRGGEILIETSQTGWKGEGMEGPKGQDGSPGKASRDGYRSPNFTGKIGQWYARGWLGISTHTPHIEVQLEELKAEDQPKLVYAGVSEAEDNVAALNKADVSAVKTAFQKERFVLENKFPHCDFSGLKATSESADESNV